MILNNFPCISMCCLYFVPGSLLEGHLTINNIVTVRGYYPFKLPDIFHVQYPTVKYYYSLISLQCVCVM